MSTDKRSYTRLLITLFVLIIAAGVVYAATNLPLLTGINGSGFRLDNDNTEYNIVSSYGTVCGRNSSSYDIFIPANSSSEWNAVIANPPAGVTYTAGTCPGGSPACTINIRAGGNGGVPTNIDVGIVATVGNDSSSSGNCSATGHYQLGEPSDGFYKPNISFIPGTLTAAPGASATYPPSTTICNPINNPFNPQCDNGWNQAGYTNFLVTTVIDSISCPPGTSPNPSSGWSISQRMTSVSGSIPGYSNEMTIQCQ